MKRLSSELIKNFLLIIVIFFIAILGINLMMKNYFVDEILEDIKNTKKFLIEELEEKEHQEIEKFYIDSVLESPRVEKLYVKMNYKGKEFKDEEGKFFDRKNYEKIFFENNFYILNTKLKLLNNEIIDIQITRDTSFEKELLTKVREILMFAFIFVVFCFIVLERFFYKKIIGQFKQVEEMTAEVNIDNFDINFQKKGLFDEFVIIFEAYETMIQRLKKQIETEVEFVQNASHELRTPIQVISGYSNLIDRWGIDNKEVLRTSLDSIKSEVKNIIALIEKLLFLAKKDHLKLKYEIFSIKEMVEEINREMSIIYPEVNLKSKGLEINFYSEIDLFKQLIRNLVKNGIIYSNEGEVETVYYMDKSQLIIKIKDNGIGMDSKKIDKIFEKFYRVDKSRTRSLGGHGLGLSIVKTILELLNGEISIESVVEKGTTVTLKFDYNMNIQEEIE